MCISSNTIPRKGKRVQKTGNFKMVDKRRDKQHPEQRRWITARKWWKQHWIFFFFQLFLVYMNLKLLCTKQGLILYPCSFLHSREVLTWNLFLFCWAIFIYFVSEAAKGWDGMGLGHQSLKYISVRSSVQDSCWWLYGRVWVMLILKSWNYLNCSSRP